jgi:hypothetical protein
MQKNYVTHIGYAGGICKRTILSNYLRKRLHLQDMQEYYTFHKISRSIMRLTGYVGASYFSLDEQENCTLHRAFKSILRIIGYA